MNRGDARMHVNSQLAPVSATTATAAFGPRELSLCSVQLDATSMKGESNQFAIGKWRHYQPGGERVLTGAFRSKLYRPNSEESERPIPIQRLATSRTTRSA